MADKNLSSLDGLIQTKGAPRPDALAQRGDSPARVLQTNLQTTVAAPMLAPVVREPRAKSLTLRLSETQYERLRRFAFDRRLSHQDIIERALLEYLEQQERSA